VAYVFSPKENYKMKYNTISMHKQPKIKIKSGVLRGEFYFSQYKNII